MFKNDYERLAYYYEKGWAKEPQLRQYVQFGVITNDELEAIINNN
ncbi:hypothetical protein BVG16_05665 [Paenibacillus selenitireducens]|uniref:XkdX family protein n=1 Tax=Paenibacillus selenitireducens TaxID=1324314 RepID=A0A1T2XK40_9BACL|nr:XkdX family protein [Paenibacillus selenitireducens]OPA80231.1 hypothetical protein BVG16_05665 [Paenibacillus selenitireducens]